MNDADLTKVYFVIDPVEHYITAIFPEHEANYGKVACFAWLGEHGEASELWLSTQQPVVYTELGEYLYTIDILQSANYGYNLDIWFSAKRKLPMLSISNIQMLLQQIKPTIEPDFRAYEDDTKPGILVTVSTNNGKDWNFQTGDTQFSGACYGDDYWHTVALYRNSNCKTLAKEIVTSLKDQVAEHSVADYEYADSSNITNYRESL